MSHYGILYFFSIIAKSKGKGITFKKDK